MRLRDEKITERFMKSMSKIAVEDRKFYTEG
jgi:hypothetical protein